MTYEELERYGFRQSMSENTEIQQMLELSEKDFKAAILKMLQEGMVNTFKINEKKKLDSISRIIEDMQKNKVGILKLKNKIYKI